MPKENKPPAVGFVLELNKDELVNLRLLLEFLHRDWPQMLHSSDLDVLAKLEELRNH